MSGQFNSNSSSAKAAETSSHADDILDKPTTPLPITPLAPTEEATLPINTKSSNPSTDTSIPSTCPHHPPGLDGSSGVECNGTECTVGGGLKLPSHLLTKTPSPITNTPSLHQNPPHSTQSTQSTFSSGAHQTPPQEGKEWKPSMARKQSWNQEDWKHDLQMGQMRKSTGSQPGVEERGTVLGFTEVGGDNVRFSQS